MHNTYFIMRHGQSKANVAGIILSDPESGKKADYTLTPAGEEQVRESVSKFKDSGELDKKTVIVSSPFSRCMRTAEIAKEVLGVTSEIIVDDRLRERWFGDWENSSDENYEKVWAQESKEDPDHTAANVESTRSVQERTLALIDDLEARYDNKTILLSSHGDTLQILYTGMQKLSPALHRDIPHLQTAEVRKI